MRISDWSSDVCSSDLRFAQRLGDVGDVPDPERDRIGVEEAVGELERFGIGLGPHQPVDPALLRAIHADFQHRRVDVRDGDGGARSREPEGDVAGAARHIENLLTGARLYPADEAILPARKSIGWGTSVTV